VKTKQPGHYAKKTTKCKNKKKNMPVTVCNTYDTKHVAEIQDFHIREEEIIQGKRQNQENKLCTNSMSSQICITHHIKMYH
jgi:hypothetical protein